MEDAIKAFTSQFSYSPEITGELPEAREFFLCGMGGSHLAAHLIRGMSRGAPLHIRSDYGMPEMSEEQKEQTLFIASSYSGNTEETISFAEEAIKQGVKFAVVTTGGKLLELAKEHSVPYIILPTGVQPRMALGYFLFSLLHIMGEDEITRSMKSFLPDVIKPEEYKKDGQELAEVLYGKLPIIYSSTKNKSVAYTWKIMFNETGKIPAFYNVFPELNHNEMTGFDITPTTRPLSENMIVVLLADSHDHPQVQKRMSLVEKMYEDRGIEVVRKEFTGEECVTRYLRSILLGAWTALSLSKKYGTEPNEVPMVEEFKKQL